VCANECVLEVESACVKMRVSECLCVFFYRYVESVWVKLSTCACVSVCVCECECEYICVRVCVSARKREREREREREMESLNLSTIILKPQKIIRLK